MFIAIQSYYHLLARWHQARIWKLVLYHQHSLTVARIEWSFKPLEQTNKAMKGKNISLFRFANVQQCSG